MSDLISREDVTRYFIGLQALDKITNDNYDGKITFEEVISRLWAMLSAEIDRDVPKKPKEIMDSTWGIHRKQAVCPECDYYLGYVAFLGGRKGKRVTYCEHCGQAIDWEGWNFDE